MNKQISVGEQLNSQLLYERQKAFGASKTHLPAPTVVAAGLQVPENVGSVLRLADAAGVGKVIFLHNDENPAHPMERIHRSARNTEALVEWESCAQEQFLELNHTVGPLVALELTTASTSIFAKHLPEQCTFLIGNESHGIPSKLLNACQQAVHIPMYGVNGSMNVSHALAIVLFEWRRRYSE